MKSALVAAALAASVSGAALEPRQGWRTTTRGPPGAAPSSGPDVGKCGLDAFVGHTAEASLFCSSILKGGTKTATATSTIGQTTTTRTTVFITIGAPTSAIPSSTPRPPSSTAKPPTSPSSSAPAPSGSASCGIVGYTKDTAAYYFDSSGTKNTWAACSAACKSDTKCKSFGYGEANCMLFDVPAANNVNYNPMSPYTFYDQSCPAELPVKKRQINISLNLPGGVRDVSSACNCLLPSGAAATTTTITSTITGNRVTKTETVTRTVSLLPGQP